MMDVPQYLFLDFEFTMPETKTTPNGFSPEIIEVGLVAVVDEQIVNQFSSYVKPLRFPQLTDRCKSFLNITQEQIDSGMSFYELVSLLRQYDRERPTTVVTWGNMDMKVLRENCQSARVEFPFTGEHRDLAMEYKRFFGNKNQTALRKAVQEYGNEGIGKAHCALDDAFTAYTIFRLIENDKKYLAKTKPPTIGERIDFTQLRKKFAL
ncbi:or 3'-5' exonuclease KapD [Geobacillus thermodenitrificans]|jgi:sporulation inhibitor KapD|nr:or 3'-5' exonuclease KapD [Geobacillus thermodenitrificans]ATO38015.1 or 3'-5' exonuclease KapD [Geobacillus thermodenitrificans]MEC5187725.1 sporulation inhibitor KapD [Geobacillus thermodenitrificans]PJW19724.1 or 3'-5' exonuclease KapD [Geobacillus thermodenitrificans]